MQQDLAPLAPPELWSELQSRKKRAEMTVALSELSNLMNVGCHLSDSLKFTIVTPRMIELKRDEN